MPRTRLINAIICILILQGCAIIPEKKVHNWPGEARLYTQDIRRELFPEQKYFDLKKGEKQKLGLALSGGGVRSASFSIGALSGLQEADILKHVDVISTVSGGGYAGYWFMNSLLALENSNNTKLFNRDELFADCLHREICIYDGFGSASSKLPVCKKGEKSKNIYRRNAYRFQNHLAERTDLLCYTQNNILQYGELWGKLFVAQVPSILSHHVTNSLFDWGANVSRWRKYYQNGIERTYGLIPVNIEPESYGDKQYSNACSSLGLRNARAEEYDFQHLRYYIKKRWKECPMDLRDKGKCNRPPLWIINTTAGVANRLFEFQESTQPLNKIVFSISPFGYGTSEYGFVDGPMDQFSVSKAVSISGAAMDSQVKGSRKNGELLFLADQLLCTNLGYSIDNYNPERSNIANHRLLPWPFYYLHGFTRNKDSVDIYLSDGGHSENLGAYPLIIRGIPQIIIIDAEYDNDGKFKSLMELKNALEKEEKLYLSFYDYKSDCQKNKDKQSEEEFKDMLEDRDPHVKQSVLHLKVKGFHSGYISEDDKKNFVEIIYVKSSLNPAPEFMDKNNCTEKGNKKGNAYPCTVVAYYKHEQDILKKKSIFSRMKHNNTFPQHKTFAAEIKSSPAYYYAYRDLASYIIQHNMRWVKGKLMMIDSK